MHSIYISEGPLKFGGYEVKPENAFYLVLGMPLDQTVSFTPGTRFAPYYIRLVSQHIEYSTLSGIDMDEYPGSDIGDIPAILDVNEYIYKASSVIQSLLNNFSKPLIILGGEHTISLAIVKAYISKNLEPCLVVFDAHFDFRNTYMGSLLNHATVMRRITEAIGSGRILMIGVRAYSMSEELKEVKNREITYITSLDITQYGLRGVLRRVRNWLNSQAATCKVLHVSVDMDVIDPAYAPGVSNPEPMGLTSLEAFILLREIITHAYRENLPVLSVDIVEVNPLRDCNNITSILAAKIAIESIAAIIANQKERIK